MTRLKQWLDVAATVAVIVVAGCTLWVVIGPRADRDAGAQRAAGVLSESQQQIIEIPKDKGELQVDRAVIVEFTDYQCPFCRQYTEETRPTVEADLVATGEAVYVTMSLPLEQIHPLARRAAASAECASIRGKFSQMHRLLFRPGADLSPAGLRAGLMSLGLSGPPIEECVVGDGDKRVASSVAAALKLGVNVTPSFVIGRAVDGGRLRAMRVIAGMADVVTLATAVAEVNAGE